MAGPGEGLHEIGRAYLFTLNGCLAQVVPGFTLQYNVYRHAEKLSFKAPTLASYSFDASARLIRPAYDGEVLIESKGYKTGSGLLSSYKAFLAKAYVTCSLYTWHARDLFWFVTNVPFAPATGRNLTDYKWIHQVLTGGSDKDVSSILGDTEIVLEKSFVLSQRIGVCILTDSFMKLTGIKYGVEKDDNLWGIMARIHGGVVPTTNYQELSWQIARENRLDDPDHIEPGQSLSVPWLGVDWPDE